MKDNHQTAWENLRHDGYEKFVAMRARTQNRELAILRQFFMENPSEEIDEKAFEEFKQRFPEIRIKSITLLRSKRTILRKKGVL